MPPSRGWYNGRLSAAQITVLSLVQGIGQGLESSLDPFQTTRRSGRPVLAAQSAHNGFARGGRLTAGCPAFLAITTPLPFRDDRPIVRSPKCRAACAIAHRHRQRRGGGFGYPPRATMRGTGNRFSIRQRFLPEANVN